MHETQVDQDMQLKALIENAQLTSRRAVRVKAGLRNSGMTRPSGAGPCKRSGAGPCKNSKRYSQAPVPLCGYVRCATGACSWAPAQLLRLARGTTGARSSVCVGGGWGDEGGEGSRPA